MKKLVLLIFFFSLNSFALDIEKKCPNIVKNNQSLSAKDRFNKALEYKANYFEKDKTLEAFCILEDLSKQGDVDAEAALAMFYTDNALFDKNLEKSFKMTKTLAEKDSKIAINNLGVFYSNGIFVEQDFNKAVSYYLAAIEKGYSPAKIGLSYAYFTGQGVPLDISKAIALAFAASQDRTQFGYNNAMTNLGFYYGAIGQKDKKVLWTEKAAKEGEPIAQINLGVMYATDNEILNKEKSLFWLNKAIERNNPDAYFRLGFFYDKGTPAFEKNNEKAIAFYLKAAELGNDKAQYQLGNKLFWNNQEKRL